VRTVIMRAAAAAESEFGGSSDAPAGLWDPAVAAGSDPEETLSRPVHSHRSMKMERTERTLLGTLNGSACRYSDGADVLGPGEIRWLSVRTQPFTG
jgi:hypothetical protein